MQKFFLFLVMLSLCFHTHAQLADTVLLKEFIGVNTNVAAYDENYLDDLARCAKWIREYHSWGHFEAADNYYKWDNITTQPQGYTWPDHNKFMNECKRYGINVLIDVLHKPGWAGSHLGAYTNGDGTKPEHYLDKLEFIGQLVARYGAQSYPDSLLETADKVSGLHMIKYYEDDNEPDYWWESPRWPAAKYAVYCNAVHDGYGIETSADYPLLGIKSVDSTAQHVLAGLASNAPNYIQNILDESNGRIPFDIINIHTYCKDSDEGYSPEHESFGLEKNLGGFMDWRNQKLPGLPVWITEFGWDTYLSNNSHSYVYAPEPQQANYLLRSYFILLKMGFEKAFMFMAADPNSNSIQQYSSSGLIKDKNNGWQKKTSYYYMSTLQKMLGNATFKKVKQYKELVSGSNEVYCFEFLNNNEEYIYAIWTRQRFTKTDNGTILNYNLELDFQPKNAYVVTPKNNKFFGEQKDLIISGNQIPLIISETPQFVVVKELPTSVNRLQKNVMDFTVWPNPAKKNLNIEVNTNADSFIVTVWNSKGRIMQKEEFYSINDAAKQNIVIENLQSGLYFVSVFSGNQKVSKKVIVI